MSMKQRMSSNRSTFFVAIALLALCFIVIGLLLTTKSEKKISAEGAFAGSDEASRVVEHQLTPRQLCDLEMILVGAFKPLESFLDEDDYQSVLDSLRLKSGAVWPMPIMLDLSSNVATQLQKGDILNLRGPEGVIHARLNIDNVWQVDRVKEAKAVFGTTDRQHPGVKYLYDNTEDYYVSGELVPEHLLEHSEFLGIVQTPNEVKAALRSRGLERVVAFQTRNPMHRAHVALTQQAAKKVNAHLLLQPVVGVTKPGDVEPFTRLRCYKKVLQYYPEGSVSLSAIPLAMRMAGPREALWHALIRKNYGATHFIIGRDHAGPGNDSNGMPFYEPYAAQELVRQYTEEIGVEPVTSEVVVYVEDEDQYLPINEVRPGQRMRSISGTELRRRLRSGEEIPEWFTYPEVAVELKKQYPSKQQQGFTVFFTGLSGAGKSTIARALATKLRELQDRPVVLLDGDIVRTHLSKGLGFSKEARSTNVRRVGFVAKTVTECGGVAICSLIAPYEKDRQENCEDICKSGGYFEIHVATSLQECEARDVKGLYARARSGEISQMTGIDDPYEEPKNPALVIETPLTSPGDATDQIVALIRDQGYLN